MKSITKAFYLLACSGMLSALPAQQQKAIVATLVLQPELGAGNAAVIIHRASGQNVLAFTRSSFSPALLGMAIRTVERSVAQPVNGPEVRTYIPMEMDLPASDPVWGGKLTEIAQALVARPHRNARRVGDVQTMTVALPPAPACKHCPSEVTKD